MAIAILALVADLPSMTMPIRDPSRKAGIQTPNRIASTTRSVSVCATRMTSRLRIGATTSSRKPCAAESSLRTSSCRPAACAREPYWISAELIPTSMIPPATPMRTVRNASRP